MNKLKSPNLTGAQAIVTLALIEAHCRRVARMRNDSPEEKEARVTLGNDPRHHDRMALASRIVWMIVQGEQIEGDDLHEAMREAKERADNV